MNEHDRGLSYDLATLLSRRSTLTMLAGALVTLVGCASDDAPAAGSRPTSAGSATSEGAASSDCDVIPDETGGPFPGDGSNGPNVLTQSGVVRSDITTSFGSMSGTATGVPLTINLTILDSSAGCAPFARASVYLWHCDQLGRYSLYSQGATDQNYLRGVQEADSAGKLTFTSIFPAAYSGRWPHIHFEVYRTLAAATSADNVVKTSQLALPQDACDLVYATDGYGDSVRTMAQTSLDRDNVFNDGYDQQLAGVSGDVSGGFTAELTVTV